MTHNRVQNDEFTLTQEFMGQMLGVRRPTVSTTANLSSVRNGTVKRLTLRIECF
jgi:hypothetical protein